MEVYYIIWVYQVDPGKAKDFETAYSKTGVWFKFLEECDEFLGLELIRNTKENTYLAIDKWISDSSYEKFRKENQARYDDINQQVKVLFKEENLMGTFKSISV